MAITGGGAGAAGIGLQVFGGGTALANSPGQAGITSTGGAGTSAGGSGLVATGGVGTNTGGAGVVSSGRSSLTGGAGGTFTGGGGFLHTAGDGVDAQGGALSGGANANSAGVGVVGRGGANTAGTGGGDGGDFFGGNGASGGNGIVATAGDNASITGQDQGPAGGSFTGGKGSLGGSGVIGIAFDTHLGGNATGGSGGVFFGGNSFNSGAGGIGVLATGGIQFVNNAGVGQNYAGYFIEDVFVNGKLTKSAGSFKIDHPLDPANRYLYHSFVESPDMMNIYNGIVTLDFDGRAEVTLPAWFEALNRDFRYQVTAIGAPAPNLHISRKVQNLSFEIGGGSAGLEVSWQLTGIRHDAYAEANRIPVEEDKPAAERGFYLAPRALGQPEERSIGWARFPQIMQGLKKRREDALAGKGERQ